MFMFRSRKRPGTTGIITVVKTIKYSRNGRVTFHCCFCLRKTSKMGALFLLQTLIRFTCIITAFPINLHYSLLLNSYHDYVNFILPLLLLLPLLRLEVIDRLNGGRVKRLRLYLNRKMHITSRALNVYKMSCWELWNRYQRNLSAAEWWSEGHIVQGTK